tara:strand:+ start:1763 stop:2602 length:840 start_codon:yes stop_codon:yes gene_type:complete
MTIMVIFGGPDAEESAARRIAREAGCALATATTNGVRVSAGTAYKADGFNLDEGDLDEVTEAVIFECAPAAAQALPVVARCDHHNPGDPGWDKGASEYWEASSLGQLCIYLGVEPTDELRLVAAGDHCPADAYAGQCPGIDSATFGEFRIAGKVAFYATNPRTAEKADPEKIRAAIDAADEKLATAALTESGVRDLRGAGFIDELPEAALASGEAYMAAIPDTDRDRQPTGNTKIVLGGHTTPEIVERFMAWANTLPNRIGDAYGNPVRGFAGVVVKED